MGNIDVYREFNDVNFVVECYAKLLFSNLKSNVVNVCSGNALNIKAIIEIMENLAGYQIEVFIDPNFVRTNEIKTLTGDKNMLIETIGDFSKKYNIEKTLEKIYLR